MEVTRRCVLQLASGAAWLSAFPGRVWASAYPNRPVQLTVGVAAGGSSSVLARLMGDWLSERLGQPFVVVNRPGAGTNIATEAVVRAPPDGYTLLWAATANAINATLFGNLSFNFIHDVAPIGSVARVPLAMVVHPSFPVRTVPEFIDYARQHPKVINVASPSIGTSNHMAGELFMMMSHVEMTHVHYRGAAAALTDLIGGHVQVVFSTLPDVIGHIRGGGLRALGVTTTGPVDVLPGVPPINEYLPGYDVSAWFGIAAPRHTPHEVIEKLNAEINAGLSDPRLTQRFAELGAIPFPGSIEEFDEFIANETEKWARVIKFAGLKAPT